MQRVIGFLAILFVLAACGVTENGDDSEARTVEETSSTTSTTSTTAEPESDDETTTTADSGGRGSLDDVVLELDDLPTGWSVSPDDSSESDDTFCDEADPFTDLNEADDKADSDFQQSDFGPFVGSIAAQYGGDSDAEGVLDSFENAVEACREFTETDEDGATITYRFDPLSFPQLGDDTFATRLSATTVLGPFAFDIVIARVDDTVAGVFHGGFGGIDSALTEELLREMVDRI